MKKTTEFVLGLIGGILGFGGAFFAIFFGELDAALSESGKSDISVLGMSAMVFSIIGIIGSVLVKSKAKIGGITMIISAIGGVISISLFYLLSFVLLLIAGLMGIFRKEKSTTMEA